VLATPNQRVVGRGDRAGDVRDRGRGDLLHLAARLGVRHCLAQGHHHQQRHDRLHGEHLYRTRGLGICANI